MKSTKAYVFGALIIALSVIIIGISLSYAYFINQVKNVNEGNQGVSVTSGGLTMNFATSQYINATSAGLVKDTEITSKADYTAFSITLPSSGKADAANYEIFLTDISMTRNFKSSDLKWALYSDGTKINSGDFSGVTLSDAAVGGVYTASNISLLNSTSINKGTTKAYKLYIWLSYNDTANQNSLLEGTLNAKVGFRAVSQ